jgi:hypothetical protein
VIKPVQLAIDLGADEVHLLLDTGNPPPTPLPPPAGRTSWRPAVRVDPHTGHLRTATDTPARDEVAVDLQQLGTPPRTVHGHPVAAEDALQVFLTEVRAQAETVAGRPVDEVLFAVPVGWRPRRNTLLSQAAKGAGLPPPVTVAVPVAVCHHPQVQPALAALSAVTVVVCHTGPATSRIALLESDEHGDWQILADIPAPGAALADLDAAVLARLAGRDIDTPLWQHLTKPDTDEERSQRDPVLIQLHRAYPSLAEGVTTAIALQAPHPPAQLEPGDLHHAAGAALTCLHVAIDEALAAADTPPDQLAAIICAGHPLPGQAHHLRDRYRITPLMPQPADQVVATGLLHRQRPHGAPAKAAMPPAVQPVTGQAPPPATVSRAAAILLPAAASLGLLIQALKTATTDAVAGEPIRYLGINTSEYATAVLLAAAAYLANAATTATAAEHEAHTAPPDRATRLRRRSGQMLTAAAGLSIVTALVYALTAITFYPIGHATFLTTALNTVLPVTALAASAGLLGPRLPALRNGGWAHRFQQPLPPMLLAAAGTATAAAGLYTTPPPLPIVGKLPIASLETHLGTAMLGVAIALTLFQRPFTLLLGSAVLGLGGLLFASLSNTSTLGYAYILAVTLWWLRQTVTLTAYTLPGNRIGHWWNQITQQTNR